MAVPSNRFPSPLSSGPNPHSRNSKSNSTNRRSFSGNPFSRPSSFNAVTPVNSPAGFGRRNSVGKEGMGQLQSCDEKENDKHQILKPVKVRSPANGSKNYMSLTISAVSKFTPSPRKKPLVERNNPLRTSISLSDGKATFFSAIPSENTEDLVPKSELLAEQKKGEGCLKSTVTHLDQKEAVLECPPASEVMKRVTFAELPSDSKKVSGLRSDTENIDSECLNVESNPKNKPSCFSESPVIASLDADPSIPPYDPRTIYLPPIPQFLHYKPNPRIEALLNSKEKGLDSEVKQLEDSFILESSSETFSDTDGTEESNSEDSHKDSEDSSSPETEEPEVKEEELPVSESSLYSTTITCETSEEEELRVSDILDISTPISHEIPEKIVGGKGKLKRRFFISLKFVSLLLVFFIGVISISVSNSPVLDSSVLKTLNFSQLHLPSGVADAAKANFDAFAGRFKQLSLDSISHLSMLINNLGGHDDTFSPLQFINLTDLQKDILVDGYLWASESSPIGPTASEVSAEVIGGIGSNGESLSFEEETSAGAVSDDTSETESEGEIALGTQELTSSPAPVLQMREPESLDTVWSQEEAASNADPEVECKINAENFVAASKATEIQYELLETAKLECTIDLGSEACEVKSEEKASEIQPEPLETTKLEAAIDLVSGNQVESSSIVDVNLERTSDVTPLSAEHRHSEMLESPIGGSHDMQSAYYIAGYTSIILAPILALAHFYLERDATSQPNPAVHTDQASSVLEQIRQEPTEVDVMMGESCPSEMSWFQTRSSHSRLRSANEAQSQERKPRQHSNRESVASSSECSYGSFTHL